MPEPEPTSRTPMSQWFRPGNVAFIFGGTVGLAAIGCQLRSSCPRGVNGLAIASTIVALMFGVYDRTVSEKLTWTSLGVAVQEWSSGELHAITLDVKMAYGVAKADPTLGTLQVKQTLGSKLWIFRGTATTQPHERELSRAFVDYPAFREPTFWDAVSLTTVIPMGMFLYLVIDSHIPSNTSSLSLVCLWFACAAASWILIAVDLHVFVALFTILRHFGRLICCLPFTTTICRVSRDACNSAATTIRTAQLSPIVAVLRSAVAVLPVTCFLILGTRYWRLSNQISSTEFVATMRALAVASLCSAPAPSGFCIVVSTWLWHFTQAVMSLAHAPRPGLPLPGSGTAPVTADPDSHAVPSASTPTSKSSPKAGSPHVEPSAPLSLLEADGSIPLQVIRVSSTLESPPVDQSIAQYAVS